MIRHVVVAACLGSASDAALRLLGSPITSRTIRAVAVANEEAQRVEHESIDTPHLFLGIVREGRSETAAVLSGLGLSVWQMRREIETDSCPAPFAVAQPFTQQLMETLERASLESRELGDIYVGTEHLALAVVQSQHAVVTRVLSGTKISVEQIRSAIVNNRGAGGRCPSCGYQSRRAWWECPECWWSKPREASRVR